MRTDSRTNGRVLRKLLRLVPTVYACFYVVLLCPGDAHTTYATNNTNADGAIRVLRLPPHAPTTLVEKLINA
jgi:hypothetical protein